MLIVIVDGFYLQEYFRRYFVISSSKPFRWHKATVWSTKWGFVWNSESRGRLHHLTDVDWPWKIDHIPVPSRSLRELFLRRFPYPSNAIVLHCGGRLLVKSHIRELHTRGITAKWVNYLLQRTKQNQTTTEFPFFLILSQITFKKKIENKGEKHT